MRPVRSACAGRKSLSAFILQFAGMKAFLFLPFVLVLVLVLASRLSWFEDENEGEEENENRPFPLWSPIINPLREVFSRGF